MDIQRPISKQPIPKHAERVFRGKIFEVWQWEQQLFDGSLVVFEKLKRDDTVNVLPVVQGKILLTEQEQPGMEPFIGAAGGRIDEGETPLEAAERELLEETGHEADEFVLWDAVQQYDKIDWAIYTFVARGCRKVADLRLDSGEKIRLRPVTFDEFLEIVATDRYRDGEIALKIFRGRNSPETIERWRELFR